MKNLISSACKATLLGMASVLLVSPVNAQEAEEKRYITPSEHPQNVYFGDAHIHTDFVRGCRSLGDQFEA